MVSFVALALSAMRASSLFSCSPVALQCKTVRAVFGHLSIRGAEISPFAEEPGSTLNEGIDLELLPDVPLYSGHIHTPQLVGKRARYVGSLYQVNYRDAARKLSWGTLIQTSGVRAPFHRLSQLLWNACRRL